MRVKIQPRKHKVISFGYMVTITEETEVPGEVRTVVPDVYKFQYPPVPEVPDGIARFCLPFFSSSFLSAFIVSAAPF